MKTAPQTDPSAKAIMDWGYRHGVMLTQSQVDDLIASIGAALPRLADLPDPEGPRYSMDIGGGRRVPVSMGKGKYDGQPEHAQRGWKPE